MIRDEQNRPLYKQINRYDFLKQDAAGQWYWNTDFLFSTDEAQPLANNRTQMWQETILAFSQGLFGDPREIDTQILVWTKLEALHYPMAGQTKDFLAQKQQQAQAMAQMMAQQQQQNPPDQRMTGGPPMQEVPQEGLPPQEPSPEDIPGETVRLDTARSAAQREAI